ncbi:hypothetical protein BKA58DRAFT_379160 [Alternaria rosae]|uniref:uncharacterized protein n=1 Tax=Alternaria rosae TaxID=1187941 RepID=UPI001E8D71FE|nr:uncharacterized protein BKA58DRAFT_379160 [Alternaria rosae]KAH6875071.1 hypothetical protein BKA58DRAFT_379160 [Alternaria rosae]
MVLWLHALPVAFPIIVSATFLIPPVSPNAPVAGLRQSYCIRTITPSMWHAPRTWVLNRHGHGTKYGISLAVPIFRIAHTTV